MKTYTPMCAWYTTRKMREAKNKRNGTDTPSSRNQKRSRMGTPEERKLYISAHGYKSKEYGRLCRRANRINGG